MNSKSKDLMKVGFGIATMFALAWLFTFFIVKHLPISDNLKSLIGSVVLYTIGLGVFLLITKDVVGENYKKGKVSSNTILICFLLQFTALLVFTLVKGLTVSITKDTSVERNNLSPYMLFSLLIFAPVLEEFVLRHLFAKKLLKHSTSFYILVSSFCFSFVHGVSLGIPSIVYTFILGLIWSYLLVKTGDLKISIVFHSLSNLFGGILTQMLLGVSDEIFSIYFLLVIVLGLAGLILFIKNRKDFTVDGKVFGRENLKEVFSNPGILFFVILTVVVMVLKGLSF